MKGLTEKLSYLNGKLIESKLGMISAPSVLCSSIDSAPHIKFGYLSPTRQVFM